MKEMFVSTCTEVEIGWGTKVDCHYLCEDLNILNEYIKDHGNQQTENYIWHCDIPKEYWIEDNVVISEHVPSTMEEEKVYSIEKLENLTFDIYEKKN